MRLELDGCVSVATNNRFAATNKPRAVGAHGWIMRPNLGNLRPNRWKSSTRSGMAPRLAADRFRAVHEISAMIEKSLFRPLMLVSFAVWAGMLAIYVGISMFEGSLPLDLPQRVSTYVFSASLSFGAGVLSFLVIGRLPRFRWLLVFCIGLLTLLIHAALGVSVYLAFPPYPGLAAAEFLPLFRNGIIYDSPIVSSVFMGFIAIHFGRELAEQQRLALARESATRDAQLAALRHQLSPHFLFNTLNSISALISEGSRAEAERTVLMLSDFLRFSLETEDGDLIPFEEELGSVHAYIAIEYVRYEDRLEIAETIDDNAKSVPVPPFLLQPLLENVIKHAVAKVSRTVHVSLECAVKQDKLVLIVEDDGPGMSKPDPRGTGTGLRNLRRRLQLLYGNDAKMTVTDRDPYGVAVAIWLPAGSTGHA